MSAILAAVALLAVAAAGDLLTRVVCPGREWGRVTRCGFALVLGPGVIAYVLFILGLLGVPLGATSCRALAAACIVTAVALHCVRPAPRAQVAVRALEPSMRSTWPVALVPIACIALCFVFILVTAPANDALSNWGLKGLALWRDASLDTPDLVDEGRFLFHPNYPLLVPFAQMFVHAVAGEPAERAARALFLFAQAGSGLVLFGGLVRIVAPLFAALAGAMLCATPHFWRSNELLRFAGAIPAGYADPMFTALVAATLGAALMLPRRLDRFDNRTAYLLGICAAFALFTKNEGQPFVIALALATVVAAIGARDRIRAQLRPALLALVTTAAMIAPWFAFRIGLPARDENYQSLLSVARIADGAWRLPIVAMSAVGEALTVERHGLIWIALCIAVLWCVKRLKRPSIAFALTWLMAMASAYTLVFIVTPLPIVDSLATSIPRTFFHLAPLAIATLALLVASRPELDAQSP